MEATKIQAPIEWPTVVLACKRSFTFRLSYSANYQLARWGKNIGDATSIELAAAMAGEFVEGKWRSAGFERAIDLADIMEREDELPIMEAVTASIKKAFPEQVEVSLQAVPEQQTEATVQTAA